MEQSILDNKKIEQLINYYKNKGLIIVGLNDSQGVNTTSTFFKKGLLEYIAHALTDEELKPLVINAFSLTMNKTEHIDYFLKNNLSLEEIKLSQIYSAVSAMEKVMTDIGMPKFLGSVGNVYRLIYNPNEKDKDIKISTTLRKAEEPVMIYSSGVNDLMREVGNNPFAIKKDYQRRNEKPNYNYTLDKAKNPKTLQKVIDSIERNYNTILNINTKTDIYTLGAYIPKSLQNKEMDIFRDLIISYNEELLNLCKKYGITFIDTEEIGKNYNNSENNFHISSAGHNALANYILGYMYQNKCVNKIVNNYQKGGICEITNNGPQGIIDSTTYDYEMSLKRAEKLDNYPKERELAISEEHKREREIFKRVLKRTQ